MSFFVNLKRTYRYFFAVAPTLLLFRVGIVLNIQQVKATFVEMYFVQISQML